MLSQKNCNFYPSFALAFSCAFRKDVLGTRTEEEIRILRENLPLQIPVSGFYSYGEIAPLVKGQESFFHGATLVTLLVGQTNGRSTGGEKVEPTQSQDPQPSEQIEDQWEAIPDIDRLKLENEFLN